MNQLQSDMAGMKSDMAGMKSDMAGMKSDIATIMSLLQSLSSSKTLPDDSHAPSTTTVQQQTAETDTRPQQRTPVEIKEPEGDNQPDEILPGSKESTPKAHTPENPRRRSSTMPPAVERLNDNVQSYQVKTAKFTDKYPDISLAPKKPQKVIDDIVYKMLRAVQPGQQIKPISHKKIPLPQAKDVNAVLTESHDELKQALTAQIQRCWKPKGNRHTFIDKSTTAACIKEALRRDYTHPLFIAQTMIEAIKDARETQDLWRNIRHDFIPQGSTTIIDKDDKPFHILDLYQLACQQSARHNTAVQVAARQFQNHEQRGTDARTYIANKLDRLRALLALYDQLDESSPENRFITGAVITALDNISEKAKKPLQTSMEQDKARGSPTLPWEQVLDNSYDTLAGKVQAYATTLAKLAEDVDIEAERLASYVPTNYRGGRNSGNQNPSRPRNGGTRTGSSKGHRNKGNDNRHPPDTSKPCTHHRCKRRKLPPHNAGQLDECGFLCGLQFQGIDCPNKGINDCNGRHLYRDTCQEAWTRQRHDSSTGTRTQRRKPQKEDSDSATTNKNMAAITAASNTTGGGTKSQHSTIREPDEVAVTEIEVNFIDNHEQEPTQRAKVPMVLTLES